VANPVELKVYGYPKGSTYYNTHCFHARDSSVGIPTGYGLDGPGIESRWGGETFHTCPDWLRAYPAPCKMDTESFPRVKRPGRGADHPLPSSAEVKNEYSYTSIPPLGPSGPVTVYLYLYLSVFACIIFKICKRKLKKNF
jgi:hypothetical protein